MTKMKVFTGIVSSLLFLYLAIRNVDFQLVIDSFRNIHYGYLVLCMACQLASLLCRATLWRNILSLEKDVRYVHSFEAIIIGYMGNNVLPLRMGEALRAYAMGMKERLSGSLVFASIILERLIDIFVLLLFFLALLFSMRVEKWVVHSGMIVFVLLVTAILLLYGCSRNYLRVPSTAYRKLLAYAPSGITANLDRMISSFGKGLTLIRSVRQALWLTGVAIIMWVLWTAILYFGLKAFYLDLPVTASLFLSVVINIGVMIPSSPGFIGVFQYLCIVALTVFSVPKEVSLSFSFVVHAIQYIPVTLLGWFYLTRMHVTSFQSLMKELRRGGA